MSPFNAITLSLNALVTLGLGEIPAKGAAKYVIVVQRFFGWFLLSIFTISLVNQLGFDVPKKELNVVFNCPKL
jgi:hypothetical protein